MKIMYRKALKVMCNISDSQSESKKLKREDRERTINVDTVIQAIGFTIHEKILTFIPDMFNIRIALSEKFSSSINITTNIYPCIPKTGTVKYTAITEINASIIFTFIEYTCSPSPFKRASVVLSRYITGTSGANNLMYREASLFE